MPRAALIALSAAAAPAAAAADAVVDAVDCCGGGRCPLSVRAPAAAAGSPGPVVAFNLTGALPAAMDFDWRYYITLGNGEGRVTGWKGSGVPCTATLLGDTDDAPPGQLVNLRVGFPDCPGPQAGDEVVIPAVLTLSTPPLPFVQPGVWTLRVVTAAGATAACADITVSRRGDGGEGRGGVPAPRAAAPAPPAAAAAGVAVRATDCCDGAACLLQQRVLDFPATFPGTGFYNFSLTGTLPGAVRELRVGQRAHIYPFQSPDTPKTILVTNGSACGPTTTGDYASFEQELDFPPCPAPAGAAAFGGWAHFKAPLVRLGRMLTRTEYYDGAGALVACTEMEMAMAK